MASRYPFGFSNSNESDDDFNEDNSDNNFGTGNNNFFAFNFGKGPESGFGKFFSQLNNMLGANANDASKGRKKRSGYDLALWIAKQQIPNNTSLISSAQNDAVNKSLDLANNWIDEYTSFPNQFIQIQSWSSRDWLDNSINTWREICDPIASKMKSSWVMELPEEAQSFASPLMGIMSKMGGFSYGIQLGNTLGKISREILASSDTALPLTSSHTLALLPNNIDNITKGLELPAKDVMMYYSTKEAARKRLYANTPWLKPSIIDAMHEFADGIEYSMSNLTESMKDIDPNNANMQDIQQLISQHLFEPKVSPKQEMAVKRVELLLSLVEGWSEVVTLNTLKDKLPNINSIVDTLRLNTTSSSLTEDIFSSLFNISFSVNSIFDATDLWEKLSSITSIEKRDSIWKHPDFLPSIEELSNPASFIDRVIGGDTSVFDDPIKDIQKIIEEENKDKDKDSE